MDSVKNKLKSILECAENNSKCMYCESYKNGGCSFGCLNERVKLTSPNYCCNNFSRLYEFNDNTIDNLKDLLRNLEIVEEGAKNFELLLDGKISETDFNELVG